MELTDMKLYESIEENTKELEKLNNDLKRHDNNSAMQLMQLEDYIKQHYVSKMELDEVVKMITNTKESSNDELSSLRRLIDLH